MVLDIWDLDRGRQQVRRTRIINCYDNWLGEGECWQGADPRRRRAIAKGILLQKPKKPNYTLVKAYRVISLLTG
jgi:hypothetical protein